MMAVGPPSMKRFLGFTVARASTLSTLARGSRGLERVRTVASSSSLRLREICTRSLRGTCVGGSGTSGSRSAPRCFFVRTGTRRVNPRTGLVENAGRWPRDAGASTHVADALGPDSLVELHVNAHVGGLHDLLRELLHLLVQEGGARRVSRGAREGEIFGPERRSGSRPSWWTETTHPATMRRLDRHERRREDTIRTCALERRVVNADWRSSRAPTPRLARDPDA